jgi:hypothetical protein
MPAGTPLAGICCFGSGFPQLLQNWFLSGLLFPHSGHFKQKHLN